MQDQLGSTAPCYNNNYDDDADGDDSDDSDTAHHRKYTSNNSNIAAFRSCHKYYREI